VLNVIIVDDEEFARSSLYFLLQNNCENVHICGIAKSVDEATELLSNFDIDLIFLDIAMPGKNGFELIAEAKKNNSQVVFTTAFDQYALKAIKANALDYLLKPIDIDELKETVDKASAIIGENDLETDKKERLKNLSSTLSDGAEIRKLSLPNGQGYTLIELNEIIRIEADSNYSVFHLDNREKITVSRVLKEYEEILPEDQFVRIHKSSIVNLNYLKEYNSRNGLEVVLKNGEKIAVSRRRASIFVEKVKSYTRFTNDK
jgi:two-component system LytT family response regulator